MSNAAGLEWPVSLAQMVEHLCSQRFLWPSFNPLNIPLAVYDGGQTFLFRHPRIPDGFEAMENHMADGLVYRGHHPSFNANTCVELGDRLVAAIICEKTSCPANLQHLAAVAVHEAFHVFQQEHPSAWKSANEADAFTYPSTDAYLLSLRRQEMEALRRAVLADTPTDKIGWTTVALAIRRQRFSKMDAQSVTYERRTELIEGVATYVEARSLRKKTVEYPVGGYHPQDVRRSCYASGHALAILLDVFSPNWQMTVNNTEWSLDSFLAESLTDKQAPTEQCGFSEAEVESFWSSAQDDVSALKTEQLTRQSEFFSKPGKRVVVKAESQPLFLAGFDPMNVHLVSGGVIHSRFLRLRNQYGQIETLGVEAFSEGIGPHPLFNGITRLEVVGAGEIAWNVEGYSVRLYGAGIQAQFGKAEGIEQEHAFIIRLLP